jgi:isocitrate dehydrogenase
MSDSQTILYTLTDEAPLLATYSFLPIIAAYAAAAGVAVETRDISVAARVAAAFRDRLTPEQDQGDALAELGALVTRPDANVIKLPNISASMPQLKAAIAELQARGYDLPDYPDAPSTDDERAIRARYDKVKGSAVNPVLREGNSDRRAPKAVKAYARANPHRMGKWSPTSATHVATMSAGDFFHNERSVTVPVATRVRIEHVADGGGVTTLKELDLRAGEVLDGTFLSAAALQAFLAEHVADARANGTLLSVHLKATMMKVSDPVIFGYAVRAYFTDLFAHHAGALDAIGWSPDNGLADLTGRLAALPAEDRAAIEASIAAAYAQGPDLAMVDSDKGVTNLHVPSDVIVDASMPAMLRDGGKMWDKTGALRDTKAVLPDSSYAGIYQVMIDDCKANGAYDPRTMGSVSNVGLMAQKAEEYGSHDKTFTIASAGVVRVVDASGAELMSHRVHAGDLWRACQTKDAPIRDWVQLAVRRARATGVPAVFWLDADRAHDAQLIVKVRETLATLDTDGLELHILAPVDATRLSVDRIRQGLDTISVTGNVLRDYLTDLFPILEVGTSAKMLSIVPLMNGGGLFETGAGGSAPKHVQQLQKENFLRWDSLGEFLALAVSLEHLADRFDNKGARILGAALDDATTRYLLENRSPARAPGGPDNRGSHFYVAMYWAQALAAQTDDPALAARFGPVAAALSASEATIVAELAAVQGHAADIGGYYMPDPVKTAAVMRPSATLNAIISAV